MKKRGTGRESGRDQSVERSDALAKLVTALEGTDVTFPARLEDVQEAGRDVNVRLNPQMEPWTLSDLLTDVPVDEFSSAKHVAEVVRIRWGDLADVTRPGGTGPGGPYGPDSPGDNVGDRAEHASPEHDDFTSAEAHERPGSGPDTGP